MPSGALKVQHVECLRPIRKKSIDKFDLGIMFLFSVTTIEQILASEEHDTLVLRHHVSHLHCEVFASNLDLERNFASFPHQVAADRPCYIF